MRSAPPGEPRRRRAALIRAVGRVRAVLREERGTVTAEFAVVLPAALVVLGLAIGGVLLAAQRVALVSLAGEVARLEARGDADAAEARLAHAGLDVDVERRRDGALLCVGLSTAPGRGALAAITISAESCAAVSGEAAA